MKKILLIGTGGTIASAPTDEGLAKLMWLLARTKDQAEVSRLFYTPVAGDILWTAGH